MIVANADGRWGVAVGSERMVLVAGAKEGVFRRNKRKAEWKERGRQKSCDMKRWRAGRGWMDAGYAGIGVNGRNSEKERADKAAEKHLKAERRSTRRHTESRRGGKSGGGGLVYTRALVGGSTTDQGNGRGNSLRAKRKEKREGVKQERE